MLTSAHRVVCDISGPRNDIKFGNQLSHHRSDSADISFESWKSALFESINGLFMGHSPVERQSAQSVDFSRQFSEIRAKVANNADMDPGRNYIKKLTYPSSELPG